MNDPTLIVGHGLAGCVLGLTFYRHNIPFTIAGISTPGEASLASSGLIAPVTGRRYVKAWHIDEYIRKALDFYQWTESVFGEKYFYPVEIVRFLSNPEANRAWHKRLADPEYAAYISGKRYEELSRFQKPYGILTGGYRLDTVSWLQKARAFLIRKGFLREEIISTDAPYPGKGNIIFATGAMEEKYRHGVIPNKGEALVVRMHDWNLHLIIKDEIFIVPLNDRNEYWVGSYYQPGDTNPLPTLEGKEQLLSSLSKLHGGKVDILQHLAGIRPTVDDRRPLIGAIPGRECEFMFNGMGTKGTSLAPYWAEKLMWHITHKERLSPEVDPARYPLSR